MSVAGKVVVVTGASGIVGGGIAKAFLDAGARVVAPARSDSSKSKVLEFLGNSDRVYIPIVDVYSLSGAESLAKYITDSVAEEIDFVVSISGGMAPPGLMTQATPETLAITVHDKIEGHLWLAKALIPLMKKVSFGSSYLIVTGGLGEVVPWPETGLTALGTAAAYGLTLALQAELKESPVRVNEFRIFALVRRDAEKDNPLFAGAPAVPVSKVAERAVKAMTDDGKRDSVVKVYQEELE